MSTDTVYATEAELRETLSEVDQMLEHFRIEQNSLERQRGELADKMQGASVIHAKQQEEFAKQTATLDREQDHLVNNRQPFLEARERLQMQLDAKQDAKLAAAAGSPPRGPGGGGGDGSGDEPSVNAKRGQSRPKPPAGPVTKAQIEQLKRQLKAPKLSHDLKFPGNGTQASRVDAELKRMASDIRDKQTRLTDASIRMRSNWNSKRGRGR